MMKATLKVSPELGWGECHSRVIGEGEGQTTA